MERSAVLVRKRMEADEERWRAIDHVVHKSKLEFDAQSAQSGAVY